MKQNKFLYLLLALSLLTAGMAAFAAPEEIDAEAYDYTGTYTMTESFDAATENLAETAGDEVAYSQHLKAKVFATDAVTNVNVTEGKLVTEHRNDEVGLSFKHPVPGPAEYVINTAEHKAAYSFDVHMTHTAIQATTSGLYIGVRTENQFGQLKDISYDNLTADGIWLAIGQNNVGVGSPLATASKVKRWTMDTDFKNLSHFRVYDNVKDNLVSYYTVAEDGTETLFATVAVGAYDSANNVTPLTYTVQAKTGEASETINVSGQVSQGGMYYPQLYICNMKTNVDFMSVTAAKTTEYGLTSLVVNGEEQDLETLNLSMEQPQDGKLTLNAQAPYGTSYKIYVSDSEAQDGFREITAAEGDNVISVAGVRLVKLVVTNGSESLEYKFNYEPAPAFNKDGLPTEFRAIYGSDLAIDLDDYFTDEAGDLEFYIDEVWLPGRIIAVPTQEPDTYEYVVEARNETTGKSTTGTFRVEVYYTLPQFDENYSTEINAIMGIEKTVDLSGMFSDETEGDLSFAIVTAGGDVDIQDGVWEIDTSEEYTQVFTIKVTNDYSGYYTTQQFTVTVTEEKQFSFAETFDTDKNNFVLTTVQNYSQHVATKVFGAADVSKIFVGDGAFTGYVASGSIGNYSVGTRFAVDGTSPYTVDMKFSTNNGYASAGYYIAMRANGFKQFTTAVNDTSAELPASAVWLAVAEGNTLSIGFPARQNAIKWTSVHNFANMTHLRIYDDTQSNVIYYKVVDDATGAETLIAKIEITYTDNNKTKLKYTIYNGDTSATSEFTANGVIPQTGDFYPQVWAHDAKIVMDSFGVTQKADNTAELGAVTLEGLTLSSAFSNSVTSYTGEFASDSKTINLQIAAVRGISYKVYTDVRENIHMVEGINEIDLSGANFLYIDADNGETVKTYTVALKNTPYFIPGAEETLFFEVNGNDSVNLTEYFADNCAGTLEFSSESSNLVFNGNYVSVSDQSAENTFTATVTATNTSTGKSAQKQLQFVVFVAAANANAKSVKVYADNLDVTPEISLSGGTADIILENDTETFKFEVELDYFGEYTAVTGSGKNVVSGTEYDLGSTRVLTVTVTHASFPGQQVVYTFNFKLKPVINTQTLETFLGSHTNSDGKKGLQGLRDYSLDLNTVFAGADGEAMAGFTVRDESGADFGTIAGGVWSFNSSEFKEKTLTISATSTNGVTVSVTRKVEFFKESVPPVFTSKTLTVSDIKNTSAVVSWSEATDESGIVGYNVYYSKADSTTKTKISLDSLARTTTLTGLSKGTKYHVYVEAVDLYGNINVNRLEKTFTTTGGSDGGGGGGGGTGFVGGGGFYVSSENAAITVPTVDTEVKFTDLGGHLWAEGAIYRLVERGVVKGVTNTTFEPGRDVTRAEFVAMLVRALNLSGTADTDFADVNKSHWYYAVCSTAKAHGIILGDGEYFRPEEKITRQDMMVITCRALEKLGLIDSSKLTAEYGDKHLVADYAAESVAKLIANGIIQGDNNGNVNPASPATRAETAVMIDRLVN